MQVYQRLTVLGVILAAATPLSAQDGTNGRTVKDSIYTVEQAERGKAVFDNVCVECHAEGDFTDDLFHRSWSSASLFEFYDNLRASMPESAPGSLLDTEYTDAISYILSLNKFPAGTLELQPIPDTLMTIMMVMPDSTSAPLPRPATFLHPTRR